MLRLLALTCLWAAAAAQPSYFCDSSTPSIIRSRDFYLTTRRSMDLNYPEGLSCEFNTALDFPLEWYLVEIEYFTVSSATVTISSSGIILFRGSSLPRYQSTMASSSASLRVQFDASGDYSRSRGVRMRVRAFEISGCPPGWAYMNYNCFGTSNTTGRLNYLDAQRACNSMRSNLLQLPIDYRYDIRSFMRSLPMHLKSYYTWIGLTDRTRDGRYKHYWLNGDRQYSTSDISCVSSGSSDTCYSNERCGTMYDKIGSSYSVFMDDCNDLDNFACSMPQGGTNSFYSIPDGTSIVTPSTYSYVGYSAWVWGGVVAGVFVIGLIVAGIYSGVRSSNLRRNLGASSVVVSAGRVTIPPPSTAYPAQRPQVPYPQPYPQQYPQYPTGQATPAPPPYNVVVGAGYGNAAFQGNP